MAKDLSKILNVANDFYNGAVKGAKKDNYTINRVATKNNMAKNLDLTKTINKTKSVINNTPNIKTKVTRNKNIPNIPVNKPTAAMKAGDWAGSGIRSSVKSYKVMPDDEKGIFKAIQQGHQKTDAKGNIIKNADGKGELDMKKIAGTAVTVGVAGRIVTGGGLYRDRYGNVNLPGIPFI